MDTPTCDVRRGTFSKWLVMANHAHTWWYNISLLRQQINQPHMVNYLRYQGSMVLQESWQGFKSFHSSLSRDKTKTPRSRQGDPCSPSTCWFPLPGHFTQVVWKETTEVGVGLATDGKKVFVVAQYKPAGNMNVTAYFERNVLPQGNTQTNTLFSMPPANC